MYKNKRTAWSFDVSTLFYIFEDFSEKIRVIEWGKIQKYRQDFSPWKNFAE
jgi:hypothetical protein